VYRQVADLLRAWIDANPEIRRVPSIRTLQQEYGVAQGTAVHALELLRDEGLITPVIGKGYYVTGR
jgi:GntR family transcriptional regulator